MLNFSTSIQVLHNECIVFLSPWLRYTGYIVPNQYLIPLKSRLSLHSNGTERGEVPQKWILNFNTLIQVLHNECIVVLSAVSPWLRYTGHIVPNQYLNPLKSRLSPHSNGIEREEVPQKWILNFSTLIQVELNESIDFLSAGSPWLLYTELIVSNQELNPLESRLFLHCYCTESDNVPQKCILNFSTSIQVLHNESIVFLSAGSPSLRYTRYIVPNQYLNPLKSRLSLHCYGTKSEEVPQKWILNFSTSIQVELNESIVFLSAGSPWLLLTDLIVSNQELNPLKSRLFLHCYCTKSEEVPQKWILNFSTSIQVELNESIIFLSAGSPSLRYTRYIVPNQYLNPLKSRLSLHCYGTKSEEVPQKWILNFSTSIQVELNESIVFLSAGSPWLLLTDLIVSNQELNPLKSRLFLHCYCTKSEEVPQKWILNFSTSIQVELNESIIFLSAGSPSLRYTRYIVPNQYLNPLKSRLSLHCYGTKSEEVPQKWILNFSTSIQVELNESIVFLSAGSPWLLLTDLIVSNQELNPLKSRLFLHCYCTKSEEVPQKWILNFSTSIQVEHNESIIFLSAGSPSLRYTRYIVPNQYLNPLKSRLSLHCYGTKSEEVPQKWILNFSTSIQVELNESIVFLSAGSPWLLLTDLIVSNQELNPLKSRLFLHCYCTKSEEVPQKWILNFSTSIQVELNESIVFLSAGPPWLLFTHLIVSNQELNPLKSRLSLHSYVTESEEVPQ